MTTTPLNVFSMVCYFTEPGDITIYVSKDIQFQR